MVVRALRAVLALLVVSLGLVVGNAGAASACTCATTSLAERVESADVVFLATVEDVIPEPVGYSYVLQASRAYKGAVEHATEVESLAGPGACGLGRLEKGEQYIFFADGPAAPYEATTCGGTKEHTTDRIARIEAERGDGRAVAAPPPPAPTMTRVEESPPLGFARMAAPGVAAVLLGALGLFVVRRLARR